MPLLVLAPMFDASFSYRGSLDVILVASVAYHCQGVPMARIPQNWEQANLASDKRCLLLSFVHTQPLPGTFIPSPPSLQDAGRLIR